MLEKLDDFDYGNESASPVIIWNGSVSWLLGMISGKNVH